MFRHCENLPRKIHKLLEGGSTVRNLNMRRWAIFSVAHGDDYITGRPIASGENFALVAGTPLVALECSRGIILPACVSQKFK